VLAAKAARSLSPDFLLGDRDQLVELDESHHFTSACLNTLDFYGDHTAVRFNVGFYTRLR
jgi:hypothetical protein